MTSPRPPADLPSVLVVEDEGLVAMDIMDLLEGGGYTVIGPVATVSMALTTLNRGTPDACVLDVNLRGEVSAAVARRLKELGVPFLLSSAYKPETLSAYPAFDGVVNVSKPVSSEKLLTALASLLDGPSSDTQ